MTLFKNGTVIDGTKEKAYTANLLVEDSNIISIGSIENKNAREIDISGKIICPGFMDIHSHSDLEVLRNPTMEKKISQGITFDISGNCGVGVFPVADNKERYSDILGHIDSISWTDFDSFADKIHSGSNIGFLQAHAPLRDFVLSDNPNRKATKEEVEKMCLLLDKSLSSGCFGLSSGLFYAPCLFADRYEMIELLKVVKKHNAIFAVHHRCEGDDILSSIDEILSYVRETNVALEISHLKAIGKANQSKVPLVLEKIEQAREEGFDISFDQYPYEYGSTSLFSLLPPDLVGLSRKELKAQLNKVLSDNSLKQSLIHEIENPNGWDSIVKLCGFENIRISSLEHNSKLNGLSLYDCASALNTDPFTALFSILKNEDGSAVMQDVTQTFDSMEMIMKKPHMCFGTDSLYSSEAGHPRSYNGAVHFIETFCLKRKTLSLEEAIGKMTGNVAKRLGLKNRGLIREGYKADLVVFDPSSLKDNSNPENPTAKPTGLEFVMVNGEFAMFNGKLTQSLSGQVIKS